MFRTRTGELPVVRTSLPPGAILAADFGSVTTRVVMLDKAADSYRLVGRAQVLNTASGVLNSVTPALNRALSEIGAFVGQDLKPDPKTGYAGEGAFFTTTSGGKQVRAVLIGLTDTVSEAAGLRALAGTYLQIVESITFQGEATREAALNTLLRAEPDLIVVVGGTDGGASTPMLSLLRVVRSAILLDRDGVRPSVLFAGNQKLKQVVIGIFTRPAEERTPTDPRETYTDLYFSANIRPDLQTERRNAADFELALIYGALSRRALPGYAPITANAKIGALPTARAITPMIEYLGRASGSPLDIAYADVGASSTTLITYVNRRLGTALRSDAGLGASLPAAIQYLTPNRIARWLRSLPESASTDSTDSASASGNGALSSALLSNALQTYALNKARSPAAVPVRPFDTDVELGTVRELIRAAAISLGADDRLPRTHRVFDMIIGGGGVLANTVNPAMSALLLIDSLEPAGLTRLRCDPYGMLPALGAIAHDDPLPTIQVLENNALLELGTAVCLDGKATNTTTPIRAIFKFMSGRELIREIPVGTVAVIPLGTGQRAELSLTTSGDLRLEGKTNLKFNVSGGAAGVVIDARGRPFALPTDNAARITMLDQWYAALNG